MATLQICYKDANGNLKCVSGTVGAAAAAQKGVTAGHGPDFDNIQQEIAHLLRDVRQDRPSAASFFYFE